MMNANPSFIRPVRIHASRLTANILKLMDIQSFTSVIIYIISEMANWFLLVVLAISQNTITKYFHYLWIITEDLRSLRGFLHLQSLSLENWANLYHLINGNNALSPVLAHVVVFPALKFYLNTVQLAYMEQFGAAKTVP